MSSAEYQNRINYNNTQIDQHYKEIEKLSDQVYDLEILRNKFSALQDRFVQEQERRKSKLTNLISFGQKINIASGYASGMNELLTGAEFRRASGGLSDGKQRITNKIRELNNKIESLRANVRYLQAVNNDLHDQMKYEETEQS